MVTKRFGHYSQATSTHRADALGVFAVALSVLLVLAILACMPAFHAFFGMDGVDAFDQGIARPEVDGGVYSTVLLAALWLSAGLFGLTLAKLRSDAGYQAARVSRTHANPACVGIRAVRSRSRLSVCAGDSAGDGAPLPHNRSTSFSALRGARLRSGGLFDAPVSAHGYIRDGVARAAGPFGG